MLLQQKGMLEELRLYKVQKKCHRDKINFYLDFDLCGGGEVLVLYKVNIHCVSRVHGNNL